MPVSASRERRSSPMRRALPALLATVLVLSLTPGRAVASDPLDRGFGTNGLAPVATSDVVALAPDGAIVVGGSVGAGDGRSDWVVQRLTPDGVPLETFGDQGTVQLDLAPYENLSSALPLA